MFHLIIEEGEKILNTRISFARLELNIPTIQCSGFVDDILSFVGLNCKL